MALRGEHTAAPLPGDPRDPAGWPRLVEEYLFTLTLRGLSPATIYSRRKTFAPFIAWCLERAIVRPADVTVEILDGYRRHLYRRATPTGGVLSFRSQQQHLIALRGLFAWLTKQRHIAFDPASGIELPKTPDRLPRNVLTATQAETILAMPDVTTVLGLRDRVMLEVLYATGVRRTELAGIQVPDINLVKRTLFVSEGKGAKDRIIPLGERATVWVQKYLVDARPVLQGTTLGDPALFITRDGTRLCTAHLSKRVERYIRAAGIPEGGAHMFRHTVATLMLEGGADVRWVQAMLGHKSLASTQIYTHIDITKLAAVHAATHPAASNQPRAVKLRLVASDLRYPARQPDLDDTVTE